MEKEEGRVKQKEKLPQSWLALPLEDTAEVNPRSFCPLPTASDMPVHFVPMVAVSEEFSGIDVSSQRLLRDVQRGYTAFLEADVLLAKITPCMENGKLAVVPKLANHLGYGSTEFHVIRATSAVQPQWLAFYFSQEEFRRWARKDMTGSAGQLRVSTQWLSRIKLPLAPLAEQFRIVEKIEGLLSDLNAGVAELKAAQKKLTKYRQSLLKAAVEGALTAQWRAERAKRDEPLETGAQLLERILAERRRLWEEKQLAKFKEQGKTPPKDWQDKYPEPVKPDTTDLPELPEGWVWATVEQLGYVQLGRQRSPSKLTGKNSVKYIRAANITDSGINFSDVLEMDFTEAEVETFGLKPGDILLTEASGSPQHVGRPVIWPSVEGLYCFQNTVIRFKPLLIGSEFYFRLFQAWQTLGKFIEIAGGVGINHLSAGKFSSIVAPLPPLIEQQMIVETLSTALNELIRQEKIIEKGLKQSSAQRQNILKAAFSGQLVPQDPDDEPASVLLERIRAERAVRESGGRRRGRKAKEDAA